METSKYLKQNHNEDLGALNRKMFKQNKFILINDIYANQSKIEEDVLNLKLKGKNLSICYVVEKNNKFILIDGHHTVIAKKINGKIKVKVKFLKIV